MHCFLSIAASLALGVSAVGQCFESNFGTLLGTGDDTLFASQPLGINFPMPGGSAAFTEVRVGSNGVAFLGNATISLANVTATGYSSSAATMVSNLLGAAGGAARIAPYWRDLDLATVNQGGVWLNQTLPGRAVITWANAVHYATTAPVFTLQVQLYATGRVEFFYSGATQNVRTVPICGLSLGTGLANPGATDLSVGATGVSTTGVAYETFASASTFDLQASVVAFVPNAGGGYDVSTTACVPATNNSFGSGCGGTSATWYEEFGTYDLSGSALHMVPNGNGGYTVQAGTPTIFLHTTPGLQMTDDSVATLALPVAFSYPGGATTAIDISSNGFIWLQSPNANADYSPSVGELFSSQARLVPLWCDMNPDGATNARNIFAEVDAVANMAYVTWVNVPTWAAGGAVNMQVALNLSSGAITFTYGATTLPAITSIVGFTPGIGASLVDLGSVDVSASLPVGFQTSATEGLPMQLSVAPMPVLGTTVTWTTDHIPANAAVSAQLMSLAAMVPPLPIAGAPGCWQLVDLNLGASALLFGAPTASYAISLPNVGSLAGLPLNVQTASLVPGANALGVITSNATRSLVNSF